LLNEVGRSEHSGNQRFQKWLRRGKVSLKLQRFTFGLGDEVSDGHAVSLLGSRGFIRLRCLI